MLSLVFIVLVFIITSLPMHIAVSLLGGHSSITKAALVNFIAGVVGAGIYFFTGYGGIAAFIALLVIYKIMFRLSFLRVLLAWFLQGVIGFLLFLALVYFGAVPI